MAFGRHSATSVMGLGFIGYSLWVVSRLVRHPVFWWLLVTCGLYELSLGTGQAAAPDVKGLAALACGVAMRTRVPLDSVGLIGPDRTRVTYHSYPVPHESVICLTTHDTVTFIDTVPWRGKPHG